MMMSLDTEVESDCEENIKVKRGESDGGYSPPPDEREPQIPAEKQHEKQSSTSDEDKKTIPNRDEKPVVMPEEKQLKSVAGIIPQSKESGSLPGLKIDIPVIPLKVKFKL